MIREESRAGVRVIRAAHFVPAKQDAVRRALYEATFGLTGGVASLRSQRPDAVLGIIPSLSGGVLARLASRRFGVAVRTPVPGPDGAGGPTVRA